MLLNKIYYAAALILSAVFMLSYPDILSVIVFACVLLVPLISLLFAYRTHKKCDFYVSWPSTANKNEPCSIKIIVKNDSGLPVPKLRASVEMENLSVDSGTKAQCIFYTDPHSLDRLIWPFKSRYCGKIHVNLSDITLYDFFGIFAFHRKNEYSGDIIALPKLKDEDLVPAVTAVTDIDSLHYSQYKKGSDNSEIFSIREYDTGDDIRAIHWKLSSKMDELYVKDFSLPTSNKIYLLLENLSYYGDGKIGNGTLDELLETFVSVSHLLLQKNVPHTVAWYNDRTMMLEELEFNTEDDLLTNMHLILSAKPHKNEPLSLNHYSKELEQGTVGHLLYFTPVIFEKKLSDISLLGKVTALYCPDIKEDDEDDDIVEEKFNVPFDVINVRSRSADRRRARRNRPGQDVKSDRQSPKHEKSGEKDSEAEKDSEDKKAEKTADVQDKSEKRDK